MATNTTLNTAKAWAPDVQGFAADQTIESALILQVATKAGTVEGDQPAVRVPYVVDDATAGFIVEGAPITETPGTYDEVVITTNKVAALAKFSRETLSQPNAAQLVVQSMQRSVIRAADVAFLSNALAPTGLLTTVGITDGGAVGTDLDALADAIAGIEADGGKATHIIAAPNAWASLAKLKSATGSAQSLLGAGTQAAERLLLSVPVLTPAAMPSGTILVVDKSAVLAAYGSVMLARSEDAFFASDVVAVRVTFRLGWGVMRPARVAKLTIA